MFLNVTDFFLPIIILLGISSIASILLSIFKLKFIPVFAVEIVIGIIIASGFNKHMISLNLTDVIDGIYVVGLSLMMFLSGYEAEFGDFKDIAFVKDNKSSQLNVFKMAIIITVLTYAVSLVASLFFANFLLSDKIIGIILLTLMFASTFAGFVVPILLNGGLQNTVIGKLLSAISNLSEALSILFLTILMIFVDVEPTYWIILLLLGVIMFGFRISKKFNVGNIINKVTEGIDHLVTRIIFVLILLLVFLSDLAGGEYIFGAFIAGMIVRQARFSKEVIHSMERIIYGVFTPMFFIIVGTKIDIVEMFSNSETVLLVAYVFIGLLVAELPMFLLLKWYKLNTVIPSMILMASTIIVPIAIGHIGGIHGLGIFSENFSQALILAGLLVCIIGATLFQINLQFGKQKNEFMVESVKDEILKKE
jgi:CPA2 family monovalent cation:H+ antiporter-2